MNQFRRLYKNKQTHQNLCNGVGKETFYALLRKTDNFPSRKILGASLLGMTGRLNLDLAEET